MCVLGSQHAPVLCRCRCLLGRIVLIIVESKQRRHAQRVRRAHLSGLAAAEGAEALPERPRTASEPAVLQRLGGRRAVLRIDGLRYERALNRVKTGDVLDALTDVINDKYPSRTSRKAVEAGDVWVFEAGPRASAGGGE